MKKQTTTQFLPIGKNETAKLTTIVNESIALGFDQAKTFTNADIWNIQRRGRTMLQRRSFF